MDPHPSDNQVVRVCILQADPTWITLEISRHFGIVIVKLSIFVSIRRDTRVVTAGGPLNTNKCGYTGQPRTGHPKGMWGGHGTPLTTCWLP